MTTEQLRHRLRGALIPALRPLGRDKAKAAAAAGRTDRAGTTLIVRAADVGDAQTALRYAQDAGLSVRIRGCPRPFLGPAPEADIIIDLSAWRGIRIDAGARLARVEPYANMNDLARELYRRSLGFPLPEAGGHLGGFLLERTKISAQARDAALRQTVAIEVLRKDGTPVTIAAQTAQGHALNILDMFPDIAIFVAFQLRLQPMSISARDWTPAVAPQGAMPA